MMQTDDEEDVLFFLFRSAFSYLSGILTFVVAWVIFGQDSESQISENSSKDFAVKYLDIILFHSGRR